MDKLEVIYEKIKTLNLPKEIVERTTEKIKNIEPIILDVITYSKSYEELKKENPFPAWLDKDNGILYAYELRCDEQVGYLMVLWKDGILDAQLLKLEITAEQITSEEAHQNMQNINETSSEEKEDSSEEILEGIPEEKEDSSEEILEGIPEKKEDSSEEILEDIPEEKEDSSEEEINLD